MLKIAREYLLGFLLLSLAIISLASCGGNRRGCCSHHGGISGTENGRLVCNDGYESSCKGDIIDSSVQTFLFIGGVFCAITAFILFECRGKKQKNTESEEWEEKKKELKIDYHSKNEYTHNVIIEVIRNAPVKRMESIANNKNTVMLLQETITWFFLADVPSSIPSQMIAESIREHSGERLVNEIYKIRKKGQLLLLENAKNKNKKIRAMKQDQELNKYIETGLNIAILGISGKKTDSFLQNKEAVNAARKYLHFHYYKNTDDSVAGERLNEIIRHYEIDHAAKIISGFADEAEKEYFQK